MVAKGVLAAERGVTAGAQVQAKAGGEGKVGAALILQMPPLSTPQDLRHSQHQGWCCTKDRAHVTSSAHGDFGSSESITSFQKRWADATCRCDTASDGDAVASPPDCRYHNAVNLESLPLRLEYLVRTTTGTLHERSLSLHPPQHISCIVSVDNLHLNCCATTVEWRVFVLGKHWVLSCN